MMITIGTSRGPGKDLGLLVVFIIIIGIVWFATGGPMKDPPSGFWLDKIPGPTGDLSVLNQGGGSTSTTGNNNNNVVNVVRKVDVDIYKGKASYSSAEEEYLEIRAKSSNTEAVNITGWKIEGKNDYIIMPTAVPLFRSNVINTEQNILLKPGQKAIIITGRSPLGVNFLINKCLGYLTQSQSFYPSISKECPSMKSEDWPSSLSDKCLDYIDSIPRCKANLSYPLGLTTSCVEVIKQKLGYNKCVDLHKNDADFYKSEWRIYLNRNDDLWKKDREEIKLIDGTGVLIDKISY